VYLAAYMVPNGRSMMEYAVTDTESLVLKNAESSLEKTKEECAASKTQERLTSDPAEGPSTGHS
jgi:hypothetical protein